MKRTFLIFILTGIIAILLLAGCKILISEIIEDVEKTRLLSNVDSAEKITRCPFCYAPLEQHALLCAYCKASLLNDSRALSKIDPYAVERRILQQAAERFERVLAAEVNPKILFQKRDIRGKGLNDPMHRKDLQIATVHVGKIRHYKITWLSSCNFSLFRKSHFFVFQSNFIAVMTVSDKYMLS